MLLEDKRSKLTWKQLYMKTQIHDDSHCFGEVSYANFNGTWNLYVYIYICHFCLYLKSSSWDARTSRSMANQQNEQQEKSVRKLQLHPSVAKEQWFEPRLFSKPSFRIAEFDICGPWLWEGNVDFESIHSVLSHNSSQHSWRHTSGLLQEDHKVDLGWIWSPKKQTGNGWNKRCDLQLFS